MHKLAAKVAIVTGAGGGIGAAVASLLSQAGAAVAVVDCHGEAALAGGHARAYTMVSNGVPMAQYLSRRTH